VDHVLRQPATDFNVQVPGMIGIQIPVPTRAGTGSTTAVSSRWLHDRHFSTSTRVHTDGGCDGSRRKASSPCTWWPCRAGNHGLSGPGRLSLYSPTEMTGVNEGKRRSSGRRFPPAIARPRRAWRSCWRQHPCCGLAERVGGGYRIRPVPIQWREMIKRCSWGSGRTTSPPRAPLSKAKQRTDTVKRIPRAFLLSSCWSVRGNGPARILPTTCSITSWLAGRRKSSWHGSQLAPTLTCLGGQQHYEGAGGAIPDRACRIRLPTPTESTG